jgi:hypothetical protein
MIKLMPLDKLDTIKTYDINEPVSKEILAVKPLGEIQAERDKYTRAVETRKRERSQEGVSR